MKRILILICVVAMAAAQTVVACDNHKVKGNGKVETKDRALASFDKINLAGNIDIIIDQNGKESATVETDENLQELIITEVKKGELNIHVKDKYSVSATKLIVHVSCNALSGISTGGSGDVKTASAINGEALMISHAGSGDFDLNLDVLKLQVNSSGSGDYLFSGKAQRLVLALAGSGDVNARDLASASAEITTAGSGDIFLKKGTMAKVTSVGSGDIRYE